MNRNGHTTARNPLALRRYVKSRLIPLAILTFLLVSLSAPMAFQVLRLRELRLNARATAKAVAEVIQKEAYHRPTLWFYNAPKLVEQIKAFRTRAEVRWILVADKKGRPIPLADLKAARKSRESTLWGSAPILIQKNRVGEVWVGMSKDHVRPRGGLLFVLFTSLGLVLGALIYLIPMRAVGRAETRIASLIEALEDSRKSLSAFNETLEQRVLKRSQELADTCDELLKKEHRLREVSSRAIAMQEAERRAIARDLHDGVGQALTAIRINLQLVKEKASDPGFIAETSDRTLKLVDESLSEIRNAVRSLGPPVLTDTGLSEALSRFCDDFGERTGIRLERRIECGRNPLPTAVETTCYRIVQEVLTNVAKHAQADLAEVKLTVGKDEARSLELTIRDNGKGFDPEAATASDDLDRGRGIKGIRERVDLMGGSCTIDSAPDRGTEITVRLPITRDDKERDDGGQNG